MSKLYKAAITVEHLDHSVPFFLDRSKPTPVQERYESVNADSPEELLKEIATKFGLVVQVKTKPYCGAI